MTEGGFEIKTRSIFELERRVDLAEEFFTFLKEIEVRKMRATCAHGNRIKVFLNETFRTWPYREGCLSINDYMSRKGFYIDNIFAEKISEVSVLYSLEFYYNLLQWAISCDNGPILIDYSYEYVQQDLQPYCENIVYLFEQSNYYIREQEGDSGCPQYRASKRDCIVDAVLESNEKLAECLLGFLDLRNEKNLDYKHDTLKKIADYLEPKFKKNIFSGSDCSHMASVASYAFNNFSIRHNNEKQVKMTSTQRMKAYDDVFYLCMFLLQYESVMKKTKRIEKYKDK